MCRWVDEVVENAPWVINLEFLAQHNIDWGMLCVEVWRCSFWYLRKHL